MGGCGRVISVGRKQERRGPLLAGTRRASRAPSPRARPSSPFRVIPPETARPYEKPFGTGGRNKEPCVFPPSRLRFTAKAGSQSVCGFGWIQAASPRSTAKATTASSAPPPSSPRPGGSHALLHAAGQSLCACEHVMGGTRARGAGSGWGLSRFALWIHKHTNTSAWKHDYPVKIRLPPARLSPPAAPIRSPC